MKTSDWPPLVGACTLSTIVGVAFGAWCLNILHGRREVPTKENALDVRHVRAGSVVIRMGSAGITLTFDTEAENLQAHEMNTASLSNLGSDEKAPSARNVPGSSGETDTGADVELLRQQYEADIREIKELLKELKATTKSTQPASGPPKHGYVVRGDSLRSIFLLDEDHARRVQCSELHESEGFQRFAGGSVMCGEQTSFVQNRARGQHRPAQRHSSGK